MGALFATIQPCDIMPFGWVITVVPMHTSVHVHKPGIVLAWLMSNTKPLTGGRLLCATAHAQA